MTISAQEARQLLAQAGPTIGTPVPGQSIASSVQPTPREAQELLQQAGQPISQVPPIHPGTHNAISHLLTNPIINAGVAAGQTLGQSLDDLINKVAGTHLQAPQVAQPGAISTKVGQVLGQVPLYEAGGEIAGAAKILPGVARLGEAAGAIPGVGSGLQALGRIGQRAAGAALGGALATPEQAGEAAKGAAAISPIADLIAGLFGKGAGAVAEVARAPIMTTKRITQKFLRNFFTKEAHPFVAEHFDRLMNDLRGTSSPETSNEDVYNRIKQHYDELREDTATRQLRGDQNVYVEPGHSVGDAYAGLPLDLKLNKNLFTKQVNTNLNNLKQRLKVLAPTADLKKSSQDIQNILNDYKNTDLNTVGDAKILKEIINDHIRSLEPGHPLTPMLHDIKENGLMQAIKKSYDRAGPEAAELLKNADERYKNQIVPFKEIAKGKMSPFMQRLIGKKNLDGLISEYVKPGVQKDQANLMLKLIRTIPGDQGDTRRLVAYDWFKDTDGHPAAFLKKWNKLGEKQKALLLPEYKDELDQLSDLSKKHSSAFIPPKEAGLRGTLGQIAKAGSALTLGFGGYHAGVPEVGLLPYIIPLLKSATAKKIMESPQAQNLFLQNLSNRGVIRGGITPHIRDALRNMILASYVQSKKGGQ
jgi:hypothetical protein